MNTYCVIMAGGVGSRFWPVSRVDTPKQFLDFLGVGKSLIRQTFERFLPICKPEHFLVVTSAQYKDLVHEHLPELSEEQILLEPDMRNTAPCVAYAAYHIAARDPHANLIVTPADHLILRPDAFEEVVQQALEFISTNNGIITLGIQPTRPDTGYGYIEYVQGEGSINKVDQFREKPDLKTAKVFLEKGNFSWNSGMFFFSLGTIMDAFGQHLPEVNDLFASQRESFGTPQEQEQIARIYPDCPNVSIDYGIMEKADNVYMINADIGWSDLGTWGSIYNQLEKDANGNAISQGNILATDTQGSLFRTDTNKAVVIDGLKDFIVIDTPDALLILPMEKEQEIKQRRQQVKDTLGDQYI